MNQSWSLVDALVQTGQGPILFSVVCHSRSTKIILENVAHQRPVGVDATKDATKDATIGCLLCLLDGNDICRHDTQMTLHKVSRLPPNGESEITETTRPLLFFIGHNNPLLVAS